MRDVINSKPYCTDRLLKGKPMLFRNYRLRLAFELLTGMVFYVVLSLTFFNTLPFNWGAYLFTIWLFVFISEGIFAFNKLIARRHPWHTHTRSRIIMLLGFTQLWVILSMWISFLVKPALEKDNLLSPTAYNAAVVIAILFVIIYVVLLFAYNYHQSLSAVLLENEGLKQDKLRQDYRALQDQINPHFLFNNLSTLIAVIRQDKEAAIRFAINFSDVYRYVLQSNKHISIELSDEIEFMKAFGALHKERLKDGLTAEINIDEKYHNWHLPPLSLQLLIENAVKHNIATKTSPLKIRVFTANDSLVVWNSINPKKTTYSTNTGLSNLRKRYKILSDKEIVLVHTSTEFRVELPLINNTANNPN